MIALMGGTAESREILSRLVARGQRVYFTTATRYALSPDEASSYAANLIWAVGRMGAEKLRELLAGNRIRLLIDATHPFAAEASRNAIWACQRAGARYIRFERRSIDLPDSPLIIRADDFESAARLACANGQRIMLTIGSKESARFAEFAHELGRELIVRVLPVRGSIEACEKANIPLKNIIAVQGPLSKEMNKALFREYSVDLVVTKESGALGGAYNKIEAAIEEGLKVVLIKRPEVRYPEVYSGIDELMEAAACSAFDPS